MISLIDVVDPDPHDIDMDEELKCLGDVCMKWYVVVKDFSPSTKQSYRFERLSQRGVSRSACNPREAGDAGEGGDRSQRRIAPQG